MQSLNIQFLNMLQAIMGLFSVTLIFSLVVLSSCSLILAQQSYQRKAADNCSNMASASSVLGYSLNGVNPSCQAYLVFRSKPPHNTVSSISALFGSHPFDVSVINSVSVGAEFGTDQLVTVPLNCSSSGEYYQANISYVVDQESSFPMVANDTFQGLSTCQAMQNQNSNITQNLHTGVRIVVPLRCACPTKKQIDEGVEYLLSYPVTWTDTVRRISAVFGVDTEMTLEANGLSEQDYVIYPFTTILVPLQNAPGNQFFALPSAPPPPSSLMPPIEKQPKKSRIYIVFGVLTGGGLGFLFGITMFIKLVCLQ